MLPFRTPIHYRNKGCEIMYYQIKETLEETSLEKCIEQMGEIPYVAILSPDDWLIHKDSFDMGFDIDPNPKSIYNTKAEVNYDSITGTFCIPHRDNLGEEESVFAFALDEKGVVFIDHSGMADNLSGRIACTRRWRFPCLERFLYDFLGRNWIPLTHIPSSSSSAFPSSCSASCFSAKRNGCDKGSRACMVMNFCFRRSVSASPA